MRRGNSFKKKVEKITRNKREEEVIWRRMEYNKRNKYEIANARPPAESEVKVKVKVTEAEIPATFLHFTRRDLKF